MTGCARAVTISHQYPVVSLHDAMSRWDVSTKPHEFCKDGEGSGPREHFVLVSSLPMTVGKDESLVPSCFLCLVQRLTWGREGMDQEPGLKAESFPSASPKRTDVPCGIRKWGSL